MAFCTNCGAQLSESAKFCSACGGSVGTVATTLVNAPAEKSKSLLRLLFGVAAILIFLGCVGVGAYYFFHRVEAKVADSTQGMPDVNAITKALGATDAVAPAPTFSSSGVSVGLAPNKVVTSQDGQCALFTREELSKVLGTDFTHADADATGCTYKGDAARLWVRTEATWTGGRQLVKAKAETYKVLRQSMVAQHYSKADIDSHVFPMMPYPGVGDEAWINLWNVVTARKGDAGITIDLRYYHDSDDLTKMLSNTALSRLQQKKTDLASKSGRTVP
jgi:zinc ribbon protein